MTTIFEKIINRELPSKIVFEDDDFLAFEDIHPKAPVHVLLVPKKVYATLEEMPLDSDLLQKLLPTARKIARQLDISNNYTLKINVGSGVQLVPHVHVHICGGWDSAALEKIRANA